MEALLPGSQGAGAEPGVHNARDVASEVQKMTGSVRPLHGLRRDVVQRSLALTLASEEVSLPKKTASPNAPGCKVPCCTALMFASYSWLFHGKVKSRVFGCRVLGSAENGVFF